LAVAVAAGIIYEWKQCAFPGTSEEREVNRRELRCVHLAQVALTVVNGMCEGSVFTRDRLKITATGDITAPNATISFDDEEVLHYETYHERRTFYRPGDWEYLVARLEKTAKQKSQERAELLQKKTLEERKRRYGL
jgi:hypothetical protein